MNWLPLLWHLPGFAAPALVVGLALACVGVGLSRRGRPLARALLGQAAINCIVGLAVLMLGLALTGHDGRMLTYLAMVGAMALVQALRMER